MTDQASDPKDTTLRMIAMQLDAIETKLHSDIAQIRSQVLAALPAESPERLRRRSPQDYRALLSERVRNISPY